jgi:hypothetical protein
MMKWYITTALLFTFITGGIAQQWKLKRIEALFGIGTTSMFGDMGGKPGASDLLFIQDITFRTTRPSIYLGLRYRVNPRWTVKTSFSYGYSKTDDYEGSRNELRGFSSVTRLFEFNGNVEYYFISEQRLLTSAAVFNRRGMINNYSHYAAYVFAGLGSVLYKPDPAIGAGRPGDEYRTTTGITATLPIGIGVKYIISEDWIIGYEFGYHQTISDKLDGFISPTSKRPDVYWISSLTLNYRIPTTRRGLPVFLDREWRRARI